MKKKKPLYTKQLLIRLTASQWKDLRQYMQRRGLKNKSFAIRRALLVGGLVQS